MFLNFPEAWQINFGKHVGNFVRWIVQNYSAVFDAIKDGILWFLLQTRGLFLWIPWPVFIIIVFILGWKIRNWKSGVTFAGLIFLIGVMGLWEEMMLTLSVVLVAVVIAGLIGVPLGILVAYNERLETIVKPILDAMQTMPSFVYLIPAIMLFGLGTVPAVFATVVYATPPAIRLTDLAIKGVSREMVEAGHAFGSTTWQILTKIELPQAFPTIMMGINQTTMLAMSMVVISSMIGAQGLGLNVLQAINRIDIGMGFEAGISIVFLAIIIDRITQGIANKYKYPK
ncbi:MAG: proline/glycine betaine ABC transporter permease [Candidatus Caldatribacteriota bacterium]|nr:proline/glycine betaine ABC transporter permease [Atribacterota bacterium]MDD3640593.1 proline/glycine betaine ABC transporter permease [Atribacterota bacterium]MDD4288544.1 proline/glycine betaine ABC transporter permease [Atribacterota bacterium]MDD4764565.1 proline/glycine betaine ABC transporter permease [Atribacterota bacterium]MDD5635516.1 proline/glycine betaine ABC transporter permease [Atribacterota bacterium]